MPATDATTSTAGAITALGTSNSRTRPVTATHTAKTVSPTTSPALRARELGVQPTGSIGASGTASATMPPMNAARSTQPTTVDGAISAPITQSTRHAVPAIIVM